ncbi:MAG TPA: hypothetical protein VH186_06725 [Chloroflexia bacterium]|nr:hypothetical protein [Chloroflexia bacterium]
MLKLKPQERKYIRAYLLDRFSFDELKCVVYDLGEDVENFPHQEMLEFTLAVLAHFEQAGKLHGLLQELLISRPDDGIKAIMESLPAPSAVTAEVTIRSPELDEATVKAAVAAILQLKPEEISLAPAATEKTCKPNPLK